MEAVVAHDLVADRVDQVLEISQGERALLGRPE
jgi:hypothetical protein